MSTRPKPQARSRILQAVHETASDLQRVGFIDKRIYRRAIRKDAKPYPMPHYGEKSRPRKT